MKKLIAIFLCIVTLFTVAFPVYASSITPYSNNIYSTNTSFSISSTGYATEIIYQNILMKTILPHLMNTA